MPGQAAKGQCLCGAITFEANAPSIWCAHCHCTLCQRAHGAAFVTWTGYPATAVTIRGSALNWFESSQGAERGFCNQCGSTLFFRSTQWPDELHIARALITEGIDRVPQKHAYYDTHVDWISLDDKLPTR